MAEKTFDKPGGLLATSGWTAVAAAIAMMALPAEALAQNRGESSREWRHSQQSSRSAPDQGRTWQNRSSRSEQSSGQADDRGERRASRVEQRGEQRATQIDNRSEARARRIENQGDQAARRAAANGNYIRAQRIDRDSERTARQIERRGDNRARSVEQRSDRRAEHLRDESRRDYDRDDRQRDWQRNRTYADPDRNRTYRDRWRDRQQSSASRNHRRWDHDWRRDNRYDWKHYRDNHRRIYSLGRYYAPYRNYRYSRLSIGFYLDSLFFSSRYWISDPWYYRLPPVYGPYRWIRYYDDALLVNIYTGEVVDVIYDFFW